MSFFFYLQLLINLYSSHVDRVLNKVHASKTPISMLRDTIEFYGLKEMIIGKA